MKASRLMDWTSHAAIGSLSFVMASHSSLLGSASLNSRRENCVFFSMIFIRQSSYGRTNNLHGASVNKVSLGQREFFLHDLSACLHEFGFCLDAQTSGVVKQFVYALVGDLSVQQFAHARLRLPKDDLQFPLRVLFRGS